MKNMYLHILYIDKKIRNNKQYKSYIISCFFRVKRLNDQESFFETTWFKHVFFNIGPWLWVAQAHLAMSHATTSVTAQISPQRYQQAFVGPPANSPRFPEMGPFQNNHYFSGAMLVFGGIKYMQIGGHS